MKWDFEDVTSMMRDGKFQIKLYDMKTVMQYGPR